MSSNSSGSRRKSGCLECRRSKRRCDEAKPVCSLCSRRSVPCLYKNLDHISPQFVVAVSSDHHILPLGSRSSDAAFIHLSSQEVGLICSSYTQASGTDAETPRTSAENQIPPLSLSGQQLLWSSHPDWKSCLTRETEYSLVQYYLDVISASRVYIPTESNLFLSLVVPVVFSSPGPLLSTVLALSAGEWGRKTSQHHVDFAFAAAKYKEQALQQLQKRLESPNCAEENLVTCVLQSSLEIAGGSPSSWLKHFRGALAILEAFGDQISPASAAAVLQYFQFRYSLLKTTQSSHPDQLQTESSVASGDLRDIDIEPKDLARVTNNLVALVQSSPSGVDAQSGCSAELLDLINAISSLSANAESMTPAEIYSKGIALERKICNVKFSVQTDLDNYLRNSAECFRISALIYLQVAVHSIPVHDKKLLELHQKLLRLLSAVIFVGQPRRSFPMWPLFIAACVSSNDEQRKVILELFSILDSKWPVSNISTVLRVVWTVWQSRDFDSASKGTQRPDWQDIMERFGWKLSLS